MSCGAIDCHCNLLLPIPQATQELRTSRPPVRWDAGLFSREAGDHRVRHGHISGTRGLPPPASASEREIAPLQNALQNTQNTLRIQYPTKYTRNTSEYIRIRSEYNLIENAPKSHRKHTRTRFWGCYLYWRSCLTASAFPHLLCRTHVYTLVSASWGLLELRFSGSVRVVRQHFISTLLSHYEYVRRAELKLTVGVVVFSTTRHL